MRRFSRSPRADTSSVPNTPCSGRKLPSAGRCCRTGETTGTGRPPERGTHGSKPRNCGRSLCATITHRQWMPPTGRNLTPMSSGVARRSARANPGSGSGHGGSPANARLLPELSPRYMPVSIEAGVARNAVPAPDSIIVCNRPRMNAPGLHACEPGGSMDRGRLLRRAGKIIDEQARYRR